MFHHQAVVCKTCPSLKLHASKPIASTFIPVRLVTWVVWTVGGLVYEGQEFDGQAFMRSLSWVGGLWDMPEMWSG